MNMQQVLATLAVCGAAATQISAATPTALTKEQTDFFNKKVLPVLKSRCYECHSHEGKIKGGLTVDSRDGLLKGGETGPAVVPGDLDKSVLITSIRYDQADLQMPPKEKLPDHQIAILEEWVKMGAPDPRMSDPRVGATEEIWAKAKEHWAFQPVPKKVDVPEVKNTGWAKNEVDRFILAKLEEKQLQPSGPVDKFTFIRRATFDLLGLPPTAEDVDRFLSDKSPQAHEKLIDRLLASPHYGERWGRYWLDVARYADTTGEAIVRGRDRRYLYAYTYRDYVIRSFNDDKPYNQFVKEQIAADRLELKDKRDIAALGFITIGKRFNNVDEVLDDRIDATSRAFLGLTVACSRCHDHKFDPIPTEDYYSWHGIFNSTQELKEGPIIEDVEMTAEYQDFLKQIEAAERVAMEFEDKNWTRVLGEQYGKSADMFLAFVEAKRGTKNLSLQAFFRLKSMPAGFSQQWYRWLTFRDGVQPRSSEVLRPFAALFFLSEAQFKQKIEAVSKEFAANSGKVKINPLVAKLFDGPAPKDMDEVARRYGALFAEANRKYLAKREELLKAAGTWEPVNAKLDDPHWQAIVDVMYSEDMPWHRSRLNFQADVSLRTQGELDRLWAKVNDIKYTHPGSPDRAMAVADAEKPRDSRVYVRGDRTKQGSAVPRRFLQVLAGEKPKTYTVGSGRLELAHDIAADSNPLTARVMVNRMWMHHFGEGIVRTPSDFGLRGEAPTHPELLDYLARYFMDHNWSMKAVHKHIMLSATYQQRSDDNPKMADIDPGNILLWKQNRRRLDFEATRDTLLTVTGSLDPALGGKSIDVLENTSRRTVYSMVDRLNLPNVFTTFDFAVPDMSSPQRFETTVPTQALFMMNSPFVIEQAKKLAARPEVVAAASDAEKIRTLYHLVFQREPSREDLSDGLNFISQQASQKPEITTEPDWQYGQGQFRKNGTMYFFQWKRFTTDEWTGFDRAGSTQVRMSLDAKGGDTGINTAAIRRWVSPIDGPISINATLTHVPQKNSTGVIGRIYHVAAADGQAKPIGEWTIARGKVVTKVDRVVVKKGDTIDFHALPAGKTQESFRWAPVISMTDLELAKDMRRHQWNAQAQFEGPRPPAPKGLAAWEKYAQVLLLTNELVYVN